MKNAGTVLGVDPGTTTGISVVTFCVGIPPVQGNYWQLDWLDAANKIAAVISTMSRVQEGGEKVTVAVEKFQINAKTAQRGQQGAEDAIGMLGVARLMCDQYNVPLAKTEQAAAAKRQVVDATLKHLGLWVPGKKHVNDATRHAVLCAHKQGWLTAREMLPR